MKKNKGITLIALVITIIVLIILAGITIATLVGENGILSRTLGAKKANDDATELERVKLAISDANIKGALNNMETLTKERLQKALDDEFGINEAIASDKQSNGSFIVTIGDNEYIVEDNSDVTKNDIEKVADTNPAEFRGEGTQLSPYLVESIEDMVALATNVNNGETYEGKYFKLTQTLDFNSTKSYVDSNSKYSYNSEKDGYEKNESGMPIKTLCTTGEGFITIGRIKDFAGSFDGNNCTIKNLYINIEVPEKKRYSIGLFGSIENNEIKDLSVTGKMITTASEQISYVGGIVGYAWNSAIIENCNSAVNILHKSEGEVGGIVGTMYGTINNCTNIGNVEIESQGKYALVGGIAGIFCGFEQELGEIMSNCVNKGNISASTKGSGSLNIGGIAGYNNGAIIQGCINYANVIGTCEQGDIEIGGVSGYNDSWTGCIATIKNSQNHGNIRGTSIQKDAYIGGISGYSEKETIIYDSTNLGTLEGIAQSGIVYKDNIVGKVEV